MKTIPIGAIYQQVDDLPALPATVTAVIEVTDNPESSARDLMQAILPDQSMCSTILKLANSAFFGLPREVTTIEKAAMVLGFQEIRNIVLGKAVFNSFQDVYQNSRATINRFWEHSFLCGLGAKIIGEEQGLSPSELFIAGLIHDIGKLVMLMGLKGDYADLLELPNQPEFQSYLLERERFSISHDTVTVRLLNRWLFPQSLISAVGYHHGPAGATTHQDLALIIQMADILSWAELRPPGSEPYDIMRLINDFLPEINVLWQKHQFSWQQQNVARWQEALRASRNDHKAILAIMTG